MQLLRDRPDILVQRCEQAEETDRLLAFPEIAPKIWQHNLYDFAQILLCISDFHLQQCPGNQKTVEISYRSL